MRKQFAKALTKIGLFSAIAIFTAVGSAQGQSLGNKIRVNIPFDFIVTNKKLPAGEYYIGRVQSYSDIVLDISNVDRFAHVFPLTTAVQTLEAKTEGTLVFHRLGDQYFLSQIWAAGSRTGRVIPKSRSEREAERTSGTAGTPGGTIGPDETVSILLHSQ
jgi:hypothetical protein